MEMNKPLDLMTISHFMIYVVIGLFFPYQWTPALVIMVLWELFEILISKVLALKQIVLKYWFVPERYWNEKWINKTFDIIFNIAGFIVGSYIAQKIKSKRELNT
jgi:hypothetical protein